MLPLVKAYYPARASASPIIFGETVKDGETRYQVAVEFQVETTEEHPELAEFVGETITWVGHFTDKTAERSLESLQIAGWNGEDVSELNGQSGATALPDVVSLACDVDTYDGQQRLKVEWVNRPRSRFKFNQEADEGGLRALGARLRSTAKALRAGGGAQRKPRQQSTGGGNGGSQPHPNAPGNRDDIPFASCALEHEPSPIAPVLRRSP